MDHSASPAPRGDRPALPARRIARQIVVWAAFFALAAGMVYYYEGILIPLRQKEFGVGGTARGNWSDLYPRWLGTRELLLHHRNPYSLQVTQEIQQGFYGRVIDLRKSTDPKDPQAFAYPVYVIFVLAPLILFTFDSVRIAFTVILILLTVGSVVLWIRALGVELQKRAIVLAIVATLSSYAVMDGLHLQQMTLLVAGLVAVSLAALASGRLFWAGVTLAFATIKPQLVLLIAVFLLIWTLGAWASRKWFAIGLVATIAVLFAGSELILPGWLRAWRVGIEAYRGYVKPSLLHALFGQRGALVAGAIAILFCGAVFWKIRKEGPGSHGFNVALSLAIVTTVLLLPNAGGGKYNQVLLVPAVICACVSGRNKRKGVGISRVTRLLAANLLVWQWIWAVGVCFAVVVLRHRFGRESNPFVAGPELLVFFFPLALSLFVLNEAARLYLPEHQIDV